MPDWPNQLYINGAWVDGAERRIWAVMNPATGKQLASVAIAERVMSIAQLAPHVPRLMTVPGLGWILSCAGG